MKHFSSKLSFLSAALVVLVLAIGSAIPCSVNTLTAHFLSCNDNGTSDPADDYFIADFTTTFNDFPATGDIALDVGGVTYSTSTAGLGSQFQFLSIPLSADGLPVQATIRFTADSGCTLTQTVGTAPGPCSSCTTDADCDDGIFCTGNETCDTATGECQVIDPCAAAIIGECLSAGACDWEADECLPPQPDDSLCAADEICAPDGDCVIPQDVGSSLCRQVQLEAQQAVSSGGPYKNHGKKVSTAAKVVSDYADWWRITEECSSCIVHQFARRVPVEEQEPCGTLCPADLAGLYPSPTDVSNALFFCNAPDILVELVTATPSSDIADGLLYTSSYNCEGTDGPGFCYRVNDQSPGSSMQLTDEEVSACEQILRDYARELENLGVLELLNTPDVDSCPLLIP